MNYTRTKSFTEFTSAKGADVVFELDAVGTFLNSLPTANMINSGKVTYVASSNVAGTANAITVTSATSWTSFSGKDGHSIWIQAKYANTAAVTLAVNGLSAKPVKNNDGDDLGGNEIALNGFYEFIYDEDNDVFKCPLAIPAVTASGSAAAALASENAAAASAASINGKMHGASEIFNQNFLGG